MSILLRALRDFTHKGAYAPIGRPVRAGEVFEATPIEAAVLTYRHDAAFAPAGARLSSPAPSVQTTSPRQSTAEESSSSDAPEKPSGRRYRRRDLEAEE